MSTRLPTILLAGACLVPAAATAQEFMSQYTSAALGRCQKEEGVAARSDVPSVWVCPGAAGHVVLLTRQDDLRTTISVGRDAVAAGREPAARQTFRTFNSTVDTIEWRGTPGGPPFAIIQRWRLVDPERAEDARAVAELLVVTRLPPGPVCHVAYVDARANREANVLARTAADASARTFKCGTDQAAIAGERGRAAELAVLQ